MRTLRLLTGLSFAAAVAVAQYPGQYPPGGYPPQTYPGGGYPPNTYPGGGYPPNTYPTRLPGGVPVGIPVPEVKLPKKDKDKGAEKSKSDGDVKVTLATVDGALRKLGEKDLVLQSGPKTLLRFRLLAKTQFRDKDGEPVRDSLLHPGDQLSVQVNTDDVETALRVTLVKTASANERASAELPFDPNTVRAPKDEDLGKRRTTATVQQAEKTESPADTAVPSTPSAADGPDMPAAAPVRSGPGKPLGSDDEVITEARVEASRFTEGLPNFMAKQLTSRYFSQTWPARWQKIDEVAADVAYVDGKEEYRNIQVNGSPVDRPPERTGTWSTGEFATTMEDVLAVPTAAKFKRRGEDRVAGRPTVVFDYTVAQPNSHWTLVSPDDRKFKPAYEGAIWIDRDTRRVLRVEQRTVGIPNDFPLLKAESVVTYAFVNIDSKPYLLPTASENLGCWRGSGTCVRNTIEFKDYRKFTAESTVNFGK